MEKISTDIGEEIISKLKELLLVLELKFGNENEKECSLAHCN